MYCIVDERRIIYGYLCKYKKHVKKDAGMDMYYNWSNCRNSVYIRYAILELVYYKR